MAVEAESEASRRDCDVVVVSGAGDGLAVGFLPSYILDGVTLEEAILRGRIAAGYSCSIRGRSDALIAQEQLDHDVAVRGRTSAG